MRELDLTIVEELKVVKRVLYGYVEEERRIKERLSKLDKEVGELLHLLEFCDVTDNWKLNIVNELQRLRRERRIIKERWKRIGGVVRYVESLGITDKKEILNRLIQSEESKEDNKMKPYKVVIRGDLQWMLDEGNRELDWLKEGLREENRDGQIYNIVGRST